MSKNSEYVNLKQQIEAMKKNYSNFEINLKKDIKEMIEETINEKIKYLIENTMEKFANKMEKKLEQIWDQMKMQKEEINELQKSQIFISKEYETMKKKMDETKQIEKNNSHQLKNIENECEEIKNKLLAKETELDNLEQYGRRENLEFHGVPVQQNENTNKIIQNLLKRINLDINENEISTSHRLNSNKENIPPPIIVRFSKRDTRNKIYANKRKFNAVTNFGIPEMNNLYINENLTKKRSELLAKTRKAKYEAKYKYLWTKNGNIFVRKSDQAQSLHIKSEQDIAKIN